MAGLRQQVKLASKGVGSYGPERANCASRRQGIKEAILSKGFVLFCIEKKKKKKTRPALSPPGAVGKPPIPLHWVHYFVKVKCRCQVGRVG